MSVAWRFVAGRAELDAALREVKQRRCPHCYRAETLVGHGYLRGYSAHDGEWVIRGRRFFCTNRTRRTGCGRTVSVYLAQVLPRFIATPMQLVELVARVANAGLGIRAAWIGLQGQLGVSTGYRLWHLVDREQVRLRPLLCSATSPPSCDSPHPLAQLWAHLKAVLGGDDLARLGDRFQYRFQQPFSR